MRPLPLPLISTACAICFGTSAVAQPMTFTSVHNGGNCFDCGWTMAEGQITDATPAALAAYLDSNEWPGDIVFDSPGGNLGAALKLGKLIRDNELGTGVGRAQAIPDSPYFEMTTGGICESACAFAFLGGVRREALSDLGFEPRSGRIGLHQFFATSGDIPTAATQQIMGQVLLYVLDMGINPELLSIASQTPPDQMSYPDRSELQEMGIITAAHNTEMDLIVHAGGLALLWTAVSADGSDDRAMSLRCSARANGWLLTVRDYDAAASSLGFDPANPEDMSLTFAGEVFSIPPSSILAVEIDGEDRRMEVALPIDLRAAPEADIYFRTNALRNFQRVLSADGTLPGAATLEAMVRACGD